MNCFEKLRKTMHCKFSDFTFAIKLMSEKRFKKQRMSIFKNAVRELFKSPKYPVVVHREANYDICEQLLESIKQASKEELITGGSGAGKSVYSKSSLEKELKNLKRSLKYGTGNHQHGGIQDR